MNYHLTPLFTRLVNSIMTSVHSRMNLKKVVQNQIGAVRELIIQGRYVIYHEIEASISISMTSIHKILHENLAVKCDCVGFRKKRQPLKKYSYQSVQRSTEKYNRGDTSKVYNR